MVSRSELERRGMVIPDVRFQDDIHRFVEQDRASPPAPGGILFLGDSDIRFWNDEGRFAGDFAGLPALNRGFGGARTWETLVYFDELVLPSQPAVLVYCCGDNDIACLGERGVESAAKGFGLFLEAIGAGAPFVKRVLYLAIHPSPSDEPLWGFIAEANRRIRAQCEASRLAKFVDYSSLLLDDNGRPRPGRFRPDGLHFSADLYREFGAWLRPWLTGVQR